MTLISLRNATFTTRVRHHQPGIHSGAPFGSQAGLLAAALLAWVGLTWLVGLVFGMQQQRQVVVSHGGRHPLAHIRTHLRLLSWHGGKIVGGWSNLVYD